MFRANSIVQKHLVDLFRFRHLMSPKNPIKIKLQKLGCSDTSVLNNRLFRLDNSEECSNRKLSLGIPVAHDHNPFLFPSAKELVSEE